MYIESCYERRHLIPKEYENNFDRNKSPNTLEKLALESILTEFMYQHQLSEYGETYFNHEQLRGAVRWNKDSVDILDGSHDTYEFDGYLIGELWCTDNGIPMLSAYKIPDDCEDWTECDWMSDFDECMFRLD